MKKISFLAYWWLNTWRFVLFSIIVTAVSFLCASFDLWGWEFDAAMQVLLYALGINAVIILGTISEYKNL